MYSISDCIFCSIASGDTASDTVYEDSDVRVFKDIHPKAPVHLLVIPKMHIESVAHLDAEHHEVTAKLIFAAKEAASRQGLKGYKLVFNVGQDGGQVVSHLHVHVLGGWNSVKDRNINV